MPFINREFSDTIFSTLSFCTKDISRLREQCHLHLRMKSVRFLIALLILTFATSIVSAYDPSPLQDFCVAIDDPKRMSTNKLTRRAPQAVFVNGRFCKNPQLVNANDFFTSGLNIPGDTNNGVGSNVSAVNVDRIPGLNTLGVSLVRIDYAPYGQNPPHLHPRATEILVVVQGRLFVGFVSSNQDGNRLFARVLNVGDVFVFPIGMIHFQFNVGQTPAVAFAGLGSQNFGVVTIANAVFGSNPPINPEILARAFHLDQDIVKELQKRFWVDNS